MLSVSAGLSIVIILFAGRLTHLVLGDAFAESASLLRVLSLLPVLIGLKWVVCFFWMIGRNQERTYSRYVICSAVIYMVSMVTLVPIYGVYGCAFSMCVAEAAIVTLAIASLWMSGQSELLRSYLFRRPEPSISGIR